MSQYGRDPEHPILDLFLQRYSPRGFSQTPVTEAEMMSLFEAARWAASSYNDQPWHFVYALPDDKVWADFFGLLVPANQAWGQAATALVIVISRNVFEKTGAYSPTHSYDTGAATQNIALQAVSMGLAVHQVAGFDYQKAAQLLELPTTYSVEAMMLVGRAPEQSAEVKRTQRKPLAEFVFRGKFGKSS